jgi:hypothetical protein
MVEWRQMKRLMNKEETVQRKQQWDLVNRARIEEVRGMSSTEKLRDLELLFEFAEKLGPVARRATEGWEYWSRLKEISDA